MRIGDLLEKVKNRKLNRVTLVYGREVLLIDDIVEEFKNLSKNSMPDFNLRIIDGQETNIETLISAIETLPMMSDKRYIVVKDFELFQAKRKFFNEESESEFIKIIENVPDTALVLFVSYGEVDTKKSKLYKTVDKIGDVLKMDKLEDIELFNWCKDAFEKNHIKVNNSELIYFIDLTGYKDKKSLITLADLKNEIGKISAYLGRGASLDKESINKLLTNNIEDNVFKMIDMIGVKNTKKALSLFNDMLYKGGSVLGTFSLLSTRFSQILQLKGLLEMKVSIDTIKNTMGLQKFQVNKLVNQSKNFDEESIISIINKISDMDYAIKQGKITDKLAAEVLIVEISKK
nr:DNA polymerase III subunit delta [uncultured Peptostreptococcus sp.]